MDDLRELLQAWDSDDCAGVQERMGQVVSTRLAETRQRITDLKALAGQLEGLDEYAFYRAFSREHGMAPCRYRRTASAHP